MAISTGAAILGGAAISGLAGASASKKAANAQKSAANQSDATQRYMYDTTREDNAPFRDSGVQATNRLGYLLGLNQSGGAPGSLSSERLVTTENGAPAYNADLYNNNADYRTAWDDLAAQHYAQFNTNYRHDSDGGSIERALRSRLADQFAQQVPAEDDPAFGSLTRNFTAADMQADPVYQSGLQFGLDEGTKGLNRLASASGGRDSGALLKALTRFGNDYASTKGNESFNRFNANQTNQYNRLAGISGAGQQATNQVSAAGQSMANNVSQNQLAAGNSRAAGYIGQSNALTGAIGQGMNYYQGNQLMNRMFPQHQPNANGMGGNRYGGYDAAANGGWGIE